MTDPAFLLNLGVRIKELRRKKNMTQNELAIECNFEKASLSRIETGKTNVTVLTLRKIIKALNTDMADLFKI